MSDDVAWLAGLSPWPEDGFGLERMNALLAALDDPQLRYPAVHVVGTNGKSTATVTIEQMLLADGLVSRRHGLAARACLERADPARRAARPTSRPRCARVRPAAEQVGATQFETITAAALGAFADAEVDVAVVEAGLGGRHDATNVLRSRVVLLTNVGLEHTDVLGETVEAIAAEKLAVVHTDDTIVVLPDDTFAPARAAREGSCSVAPGRRPKRSSAIRSARRSSVVLPGRLEHRPGEIRDGAHNPDGVAWLCARLPAADYTVCASILADKDVDEMLRRLSAVGDRFVATASSNRARSRRPRSPSGRGRTSRLVEAVADPTAAVRRAHALGGARPRDRLAVPPRRSRSGGHAVRRRSRMRERITRPHLCARRRRRHRRNRVRRRVYPRQAPSLTLAPC